VRAALRILVTSREHLTTERSATINALIALVRVVDLDIDARKPLTATQVSQLVRWRARVEDVAAGTARAEAVAARQTSNGPRRRSPNPTRTN
jgi:uncharacterized RDD family membrane protein YckC